MISKFFTIFICILTIYNDAVSQLRPGFDKDEYIEMLKVSAAFGDSVYVTAFPSPQHSKFIYRSPVVGLDNRWDLWAGKNSSAIISIRGTTPLSVSWLENFYAAMVPAAGTLQLSDTDTFQYQLVENPRAAVHVGWLVGMAFLAKGIVPKIDSCYKAGIKDFVILGHSQGGAIAYLLTAYLYSHQKQGLLPADIRFKTYCSAASKPGNLYFAYDYELMTQNGWAYNVVNTADWVPEVPMSIQTLNDLNTTNPFVNAKAVIKKQKFPRDLVFRYVFNRLDKPTRRAQRKYQKYLGKMVEGIVKKTLKGYAAPEYYQSNDYVRTGSTIVLKGDSNYKKKYPDGGKNVFVHHYHPPYLYLAERLIPGSSINDSAGQISQISGSWELSFISGRKIALDEFYPNKKPTLVVDGLNKRVSGNTGCNSFSGPLITNGNNISFTEPLVMTKMFCEGEGEAAFISTLKTVSTYSIKDSNQLKLFAGNELVMEFIKK